MGHHRILLNTSVMNLPITSLNYHTKQSTVATAITTNITMTAALYHRTCLQRLLRNVIGRGDTKEFHFAV